MDAEDTAAFEAASRTSLYKHPGAIAEIRNSAPLKADMSAIACSSDIIMHPVCSNNLANSSLSPVQPGPSRKRAPSPAGTATLPGLKLTG